MTDTDARETPPAPRRLIAAISRAALTIAVIGAAGGTGMAGYGVLSARASQADGPPPAPVTVVAPSVLRLSDGATLARRFTGQFEPAQEAVMGFEDGGTLAAVLVQEGDRVVAGQPLARLDTRLLLAERARLLASRDAIGAEAELARRTHARQEALVEAGHATRQRVDESSLLLARLDASIAEVDAAIAMLDVRLSRAEIRAPFAGRIGARLLDTGAAAPSGAPVVTVLEDAPARFRVALDPDLAERLDPGAEVRIETPNGRLPARFAELAPDIEAATRGRVAFFDLDAGAALPPARSTGTVILHDRLDERGAWVPVSALRPGPRGSWTLLVVSGAGARPTVAIEAAEILQVDGDRAYVRGSFADGALYLDAGLHRVVPGEAVTLAEAR